MGSKFNFLTKKEKKIGQQSYLKFTFINGLSFSFLAETIIYLLAMNLGANNIQLGYISSAAYLTGLVVFFVPTIFPNKKIINLFFIAWIARGIVSLIYGITPYISNEISVIVVIFTYTIYCIFRNIAYPLNHVIQGFITKPSQRGAFSSLVLIILYSSMMLSRLISFSALSFFKENELTGILFLLLLGIVLNTFASFSILKVPVKETIEKRNLLVSLNIFIHYLKKPQSFLLILLYCCGMSLFVLFNFSIPLLKKYIGIPSNIIFIFTTINFLGVILSSRVVRPFLDKFGSKPLLILANIAIVSVSTFWCLANTKSNPIFLFFLGFISMFFIGMIRLLLDRLIVNSIPNDDRIGFTSSLAVVFSIISLVIGVLGGYLAEITSLYNLNLYNEYSLSFVLMALLGFINFIVTIFIKEKGSLPTKRLIKSIVSPKERKTVLNLDKLKRTNSDITKKLILVEIEADDTQLATEEIKNRLKLSNLKDKEMIIRSLFSNPRQELEDELINEALDRYSWWRQSAIFALGAYHTEKSRQTLRTIFREKYPYIKSIAAKSLARIGDNSYHGEINELLLKDTLDVRTYINLIIAVSLIEHNGAYWNSIFRLIKEIDSYRFQQTLINIGSMRLNFSEHIDDIFYELNLNESEGFYSMLEELVEINLKDSDYEELNIYIKNKEYYNILSWSKRRCKSFKLIEPYEHLRIEIINIKKRTITSTLAIASLYFTLQLELKYLESISSLKSVTKSHIL